MPTCILNASLWAGKKVTKKRDLPRICNKLLDKRVGAGYQSGGSIYEQELEGFAKVLKCIYGLSCDELQEIVEHDNHAVALTFYPDHELQNMRPLYHDILVVGFEDGHFHCVNVYNRGEVLQKIPIEIMSCWLSKDRKLENRAMLAHAVVLTKDLHAEVFYPEGGYVPLGVFDELQYGDVSLLNGLYYTTGSQTVGLCTLELGISTIQTAHNLRRGLFYRSLDKSGENVTANMVQ